ncbi:STM4015 family protein [Streptomyces sp. CRN 30]|uniref:STM4015 family protein n=1 Tax=Streptomyces sp. CRN 30 TaxID=3075613 RepID=UPI002A8234C8|nr:STM4015 family protein [Streptomyces sp. CRN 30]
MTTGNDLRDLHGLPTFAFHVPEETAGPFDPSGSPAPDAVAWRIGTEGHDRWRWEDLFARFLDTVDTTRVRALIVGSWGTPSQAGPQEAIETLVAARGRLPALRRLFLGEFDHEVSEISWTQQGDVTPLLEAFGELEDFGVRGGDGLRIGPLRHERLRRLKAETGGMSAETVRGVAASDLPALEHLDLWLGTPEYGGDAEVSDLAPLLDGTRLPALKYLALRNSEMQDDICAALAAAPVVARLDVLDVSMGVLTDDGATALLTGQPLTHLKALDMHHNYLSDAIRARLHDALEPAGVQVNTDPDGAEDDEDEEDGEVWRYVAVGE